MEIPEIITRSRYQNIVSPFIDKPVIKVFTGQRRTGKSYLMLQTKDQIQRQFPGHDLIFINKENPIFDDIKNDKDVWGFITKNKTNDKKSFVFIDEVQEIKDFEKALRGMLSDGGFDIYCTGSNATLLSGELATLLSGRYVEIPVHSLSYRENESTWQTPEPGRNLSLTLDLGLQRAAYHALRTVGADVRGAVVVMDVTNGDVVAMVSAPAFDPNEFVTGIPTARWEQLNHPLYRVMLNRATQGAYHPGSVFKIITSLACFDAGFDPAALFRVGPDPARPGRGAFFLGRRKIEDLAPPGDYDFIRAFKRSSNTYFIHHGLRAGRDRVLEIGKRFFLGERIGLGTRQEVRGYFPSPDEVIGVWSDGNLANVCIGQEITVTPLQMAVVAAAIANGGKVLQPRLVLRVERAEPTVSEPARRDFPATVRGDIRFPESTLALIREAMLADTELREGTGFRAFQQENANGRVTPRIPGFRVGGKTGTAEIKEGGRVVDKVTWFVAFGPYETPRYAVVVMVESGGSGGGTCAPVAREVFQAIAARMAATRSGDANLAQAN